MSEKENNEPKGQPTLEEIINTPLTEAEARVQLADIDIQLAECQRQVAAAEARRMDLTWMRAVILRRVLNPAEAPADGSGK